MLPSAPAGRRTRDLGGAGVARRSREDILKVEVNFFAIVLKCVAEIILSIAIICSGVEAKQIELIVVRFDTVNELFYAVNEINAANLFFDC